jgi:CubicO group peptidase (beta-lactamase class C family)
MQKKTFLSKWGIRILLTILLIFIFIQPEFNFGTKSLLLPEVLSSKEETKLAQILINDRLERLDSIMSVSSASYGFNGSVMLVLDGHIIYDRSFGYGDYTSRTPLSDHSPFQLASVSKQFTAMAIMILKERGQINFDTAVQCYIPEFPYGNITIRHLLTHTSGLPNYLWFLDDFWTADSIPPTNDDLIRILAQQQFPLNFTPGRLFDYSNTGYAVLASIVERVSGLTFGDFLRVNIFQPLGMLHSFVFCSSVEKNHPEMVHGYKRRYRTFRPVDASLSDGIAGDKGVYSSTYDLYLWDQALYSGALVRPSTLEEAFTPTTLTNGRVMPYGFGFRLRNENNHRMVYHHGLWEGFRDVFERDIDDHLTVIILNHTSFNGLNTLADHLKKVILEPPLDTTMQSLVMMALHKGVRAALKDLELHGKNNPALVVNNMKLLEVINYLNGLHKPELARKIKQLYLSLVDASLAHNGR